MWFLQILTSMVWGCESLQTVPGEVQIVWISPVKEQVGLQESIEVVRLQDLQTWMTEEQPTATDVIAQMGMISKRQKKDIDPKDYKVTIFDVESAWLCRPIQGQTENAVIEGLSVCEGKIRSNRLYSRYGFTGCGYTFNTQTQSRGLDVYRIDWREASTWGFCVFPLERFLEGAP